jgi:hypothetical protein
MNEKLMEKCGILFATLLNVKWAINVHGGMEMHTQFNALSHLLCVREFKYVICI